MADIPESSVWDDGIRQIETTDPVVGGAPNIDTGAGLSNIPHQQLARRTRWLRDKIEAVDIAATTAARGFVELATTAEAQAGTDTARALTPAAAKSAFLEIGVGNATAASSATTSKSGLVELATTAEAQAGSDVSRALTPAAAAAAFLRRDLGSVSALTSTNDLNAVTTPGFYFWLASNPVNRPAGVTNAKLIVETVGADIVQMVWGGSDGTIHTRRRTGGTWGAWNAMWSALDAPASVAATGWQKLPSGLILQWGVVNTSAAADTTVTYPFAFPTLAYSVVGTVGVSGIAHITFMTNTTTATSFRCSAISSGGRNAVSCSWMAFGK